MTDTKKEKGKKAEKVSDALDFLEDDMIQEAVWKQQKAMEQEKKLLHQRRPWRIWASLAAGLVLIAIALPLLPGMLQSTEQGRLETEKNTIQKPVPGEKEGGEKERGEKEGGEKEGDQKEHLPATEEASNGSADESGEQTENHVAYGFTMGNDIIYFPISFDDRIRFGLLRKGANDPGNTQEKQEQQGSQVEENTESKGAEEEQKKLEVPEVDPDAIGLTPENTYQITKQDLGEVMGTVQTSADAGMIGCTVYHFASFPDLDAICILDRNGEYEFYTADGIMIAEEIGQSFDRVLTAYQMPESVTKLEIEDRSGTPLFTITDQAVVEELCSLLSGKTNIGLQASNERYAKRWKDTYGNEEVFYDGEVFHYSDQVDYDAVHEFWHQNQRVVWITTRRGFRFLLQYNPDVQTVDCYGYYDLTEEEVARLNVLLGVE